MSLTERLKRHPFPVMARFDRVIALSFAFPEELLKPLLPPGLEVDSYEGMGFVTAAMVWTEGLRPAAFPKMLGQDFFLAGYRVFARMRNDDGRRLRGLKILRSETDKARMVLSGNLMTHYNYRRIDLRVNENAGLLRVETRVPDGHVTLDVTMDLNITPQTPPARSPFPDFRTARLFAGPMPFTFDAEADGRFVVIEGKRSEWTPRPIEVTAWQVGLFDEAPFRDVKPVLANAFVVQDVDYRWEKGRLVKPEVAHG